MKLGSHNSISYSRAKKWWMEPFRFLARCQAVSIQTQYEKYGVRLFDLRIKFNKKGEVFFAHGAMDYKESIEKVLNYLNSVLEPVDCRILLENREGEFEPEFIKWCEETDNKYDNIRFFGGNNKYSWKKVYNFPYEGPSYLDKYSSTTGTLLDDWFPYFYARCNNKTNIKQGTDKDYLLIDFVNIQ